MRETRQLGQWLEALQEGICGLGSCWITRSWWPGEQEEKGTSSMGQHAVQMQAKALDDAWSGKPLWSECIPMPHYLQQSLQAGCWYLWLTSLPCRWWSYSRPWHKKTRSWESLSTVCDSWRRRPLMVLSCGRSPMSPSGATSQCVAGLSASSLQVTPPHGHRDR